MTDFSFFAADSFGSSSPITASIGSVESELAVLQENRRRRSDELGRTIRKKKKEQALRSRRSLTPGSPTSTIDYQAIPELIKAMNETNDDYTLFEKLSSIRDAITIDIYACASKTVVVSGGLDVLVPLLKRTDSHRLQYDAGWILAKICETDLADAVFCQKSAVRRLVANLSSENEHVKESAAQCIGRLAKHRVEYRDHLLELGTVSILLWNLHSSDSDALTTATAFAMSSMCFSYPSETPEPLKQIISAAVTLLLEKKCSQDATMYSLHCLADLSAGAGVHDVFQIGAFPLMQRLVSLLELQDKKHILPATRTLRHICSTGRPFHVHTVVTAGILDVAHDILNEANPKSVRQETCFLLSKIAGGPWKQLSMLVNQSEVMEDLVIMARDGTSEWSLRKQVIQILVTMVTYGNDDHLKKVVEHNGIEAFVEALFIRIDNETVLLALEAIQLLFDAGLRRELPFGLMIDQCGGIDQLEYLCTHADEMIAAKASDILEHFNADDESSEGYYLAFHPDFHTHDKLLSSGFHGM